MIVIPMAGLSSRFKKAGFELPKYMLIAHGQSLFHHSVASFKRYFNDQSFLFICLNVFDTPDFIHSECEKLGLKHFQIVALDQPTKGQAETVYLGLQSADINDNEPLVIFNIDTFRPNFIFPKDFDIHQVDGYLETFIGSGENWSNVLPASPGSNKVLLTAEKQQISEYCCTGLYVWKNARLFNRIFERCLSEFNENASGELYVAPMYNHLINEGGDIRFSVVAKDEVIFCGVPIEYYEFLNTQNSLTKV